MTEFIWISLSVGFSSYKNRICLPCVLCLSLHTESGGNRPSCNQVLMQPLLYPSSEHHFVLLTWMSLTLLLSHSGILSKLPSWAVAFTVTPHLRCRDMGLGGGSVNSSGESNGWFRQFGRGLHCCRWSLHLAGTERRDKYSCVFRQIVKLRGVWKQLRV